MCVIWLWLCVHNTHKSWRCLLHCRKTHSGISAWSKQHFLVDVWHLYFMTFNSFGVFSLNTKKKKKSAPLFALFEGITSQFADQSRFVKGWQGGIYHRDLQLLFRTAIKVINLASCLWLKWGPCQSRRSSGDQIKLNNINIKKYRKQTAVRFTADREGKKNEVLKEQSGLRHLRNRYDKGSGKGADS